jgi:hypothetical protein
MRRPRLSTIGGGLLVCVGSSRATVFAEGCLSSVMLLWHIVQRLSSQGARPPPGAKRGMMNGGGGPSTSLGKHTRWCLLARGVQLPMEDGLGGLGGQFRCRGPRARWPRAPSAVDGAKGPDGLGVARRRPGRWGVTPGAAAVLSRPGSLAGVARAPRGPARRREEGRALFPPSPFQIL